ncbi:MAG: hypothetical protein IKB96_07015 [Prevotella sp.]|nr:hypothetical protein [Prevotella sp.]
MLKVFKKVTENNYIEGSDFNVSRIVTGAFNSGEPIVSLKSDVIMVLSPYNLLGQPYLTDLDLTNFSSVSSPNLV